MPSWSDLRKFLNKKSNGWEYYRGGDHLHYKKILPNGKVLLTRCSHGSGEIGPDLWRKILKQLQITQEEFNANI